MFNEETWPEPSACDVSIAGFLQDLQPKLRRWKSIMAGDDPNSVEKQIELLTWNDSIYRSYNEALGIASKRKGSYAPAPSLAEMIHDAFAVRQMMAVRRLLERKAKDEKKQVYSVRTVLHEIKENRMLITRENYVCYDGTKYTYDPFHKDWRAADTSEVRHLVFDSLSGKTSTNRTRSDLIESDLFDTLETRLEKDRLLQTYINKYLAHGADPINRTRVDSRQQVTLLYLQKLYKLVIWASNTIGKMIDQLVLTEVATPNFDQFEGWDNPLIRNTDKVKLTRYWSKRTDLYRTWSEHYWNSAMLCKKP